MASLEHLHVGIVGTGFVAKTRVHLFQQQSQATVVAIAGDRERAAAIDAQIAWVPHWSEILGRPDVDLVVVATINAHHGAIAAQALAAGKHVVVEYPLAFSLAEAQALYTLARERQRLLHVEHIELLSDVHRLTRQHLPALGQILTARYGTHSPQRPAPQKWTYAPHLFGFPLTASLSRLHRLIDLLGPVRSVAAQVRYVPEAPLDFFQSCFAQAQLEFVAGAIAEVGYHKGEHCWSAQRTLEICGTHGQIRFEGEQGTLITADDPPQSLEAKSPRGLFQQDTEAVCRHLCQGQPLYVGQQSILRAIATAEAAETAAQTRTVVAVPQV